MNPVVEDLGKIEYVKRKVNMEPQTVKYEKMVLNKIAEIARNRLGKYPTTIEVLLCRRFLGGREMSAGQKFIL